MCVGEAFSAATAFRAGGQHWRGEGSWQQMAQAGLGLSNKGVGRAGHLHLEAAGEFLLPATPSTEKRWGKGRAAFIPTEGSTPPTPPTHREAGTRLKAAGGGVREAKVRAAPTGHHLFCFREQETRRPEAEVRGSPSRVWFSKMARKRAEGSLTRWQN